MELSLKGRGVFVYTAAHELDRKKPSIVFVHGAGLEHSSFALQSRYFGYHGRNVLAVDLPGHGRSDGPPLERIADVADWLSGLLRQLEIDKAALVGHSMGALACMEFAARHPEQTERIALVGVTWPMKVAEPFLDAARRNDYAAFDMHTIWGHAAQVPLGANPNPGMWMYGDALARLERLAPGVLYADLRACNDYEDGLKSAARVRCPALLVLGRRDMMTPPRTATPLAEALKGSRTVLLEGSGHTLMAEAPDATLDALIAFLA